MSLQLTVPKIDLCWLLNIWTGSIFQCLCPKGAAGIIPLSILLPPVQTGPRLAGKVPPSGTFPGNHIVWTLAGTCPCVPTKHVAFRGRKSTLGLVIDIAQLFSSNVRMREMCWHGDLTQSRCAQQKPLNRDCPRQAGAFDDRVDGRS